MLEVDELWSFVFRSKDKVWVWIAMNRETREEAIVFSDYWGAYQAIIPSEQQRPVGEETGETAHKSPLPGKLLARFPGHPRFLLGSVVPDIRLAELKGAEGKAHLERTLRVLTELDAEGWLDARRRAWIPSLESALSGLDSQHQGQLMGGSRLQCYIALYLSTDYTDFRR